MSAAAKASWQTWPARFDPRIAALKALGTTFFALGAMGLILPLVPTTEIWMVAAYCFAKSAPELAERMFAYPRIGRDLRNWVEHRVIRRKVKLFAIGGMSTNLATGAWIANLSGGALTAWACAVCAIAAYVATRSEEIDWAGIGDEDRQGPPPANL
ncbi:MAG: YbaN family protein [Burkholderiales bacterium]|nr:YbaN family protein [Burkholderiales bacterium]